MKTPKIRLKHEYWNNINLIRNRLKGIQQMMVYLGTFFLITGLTVQFTPTSTNTILQIISAAMILWGTTGLLAYKQWKKHNAIH